MIWTFNGRPVAPTVPLARGISRGIVTAAIGFVAVACVFGFLGVLLLSSSLLVACAFTAFVFLTSGLFFGPILVIGLWLSRKLVAQAIAYERAETEYNRQREQLIARPSDKSSEAL